MYSVWPEGERMAWRIQRLEVVTGTGPGRDRETQWDLPFFRTIARPSQLATSVTAKTVKARLLTSYDVMPQIYHRTI